jgi:hypothetical protein
MSKKVFIATGALAVIGGLATAISSSSCDQVCTMEAQPSVEVRFYAPTGEQFVAQQPTSVTWWKVDDPSYGEAPDPSIVPPAGSLNDAECADAVCSTWVAGWEEEGTIEVRANICGSEYIERIDVPMTADGCHVETQELDIAIDTSGCDPVDTPSTGLVSGCGGMDQFSVIASAYTKFPAGLVPVKPDAVYGMWKATETTAEEIPISGLCLDSECMSYGVGLEQTGFFEIQVYACGSVFSHPVEVDKAAGDCHVETEYVAVEIDPSLCTPAGDLEVFAAAEPVPTVCDLKARPSAIVSTAKAYDDYLASVPVKNVWYSQGERRTEAQCIEMNADERCSRWVAGWELAGPMSITSEYCETEFGEDIRVDMTDDGCHVKTKYVVLEPPTIGCFGSEPTPEPPPPPPSVPTER